MSKSLGNCMSKFGTCEYIRLECHVSVHRLHTFSKNTISYEGVMDSMCFPCAV